MLLKKTPINHKVYLANDLISHHRLSLLKKINIIPQLIKTNVEEQTTKLEKPQYIAEYLSKKKAQEVDKKVKSDGLIVGIQTLVTCGRRILLPTNNKEIAIKNIILISGRQHQVHTAIHIISKNKKPASRIVTTKIKMKHISDKELKHYISTKEWENIPGSYNPFSFALKFIKKINGSPTNIIGLPIYEFSCLIEGLGYKMIN